MSPTRRSCLAALAAVVALPAHALGQERRHSRPFPADKLGELEGPDREAWQKREGLRNVTTVLGTSEDPKLPAQVDAVLIAGVYGEVGKPVEWLTNVVLYLKPGGRVGVVDFRKDGFGPGPETLEERVDEAVVIKDAQQAGLRLINRNTPLPFQYLLVFGR
jgi:hypothetical protein